ncbi:MAG: HIT family protein [Patescibacteria group bacterium]|jgi:histidine triad (HIT) family protein
MSCLFCEIISGVIPCEKVYENEEVFVFLDISPMSKGHTIVTSKIHAENLAEGTVESALHLMNAVYRLAPSIMRAVGADGYNLGMNHGVCAGQMILHTHLHIMPRWNNVLRTFERTHPSSDELAEIAEKIRFEIESL